MSDTDARVKAIIGDVLGCPPHTIGDADTAETLGCDDLIEVSMAIEEEFGIEILDETLGVVLTAGDLVAAVDRLRAA